MKNTGKKYEELVQEIYQQFVNLGNEGERIRPINVQHNVSVTGMSGAQHQIDIYWEFELAGTVYKTIVEVKDWSSPVKKEQLLTFNSLLEDIPGTPKGIYVSRGGYQAGALTYAKAHGIQLVSIHEEDCSFEFVIVCRNITTLYKSVYVQTDDSLLDEQPQLLSEFQQLMADLDYSDVYLLAPYGEKVCLANLMSKEAEQYHYEEDAKEFELTKDFEGEWFLEANLSSKQLIRISGFGFICYNCSEYSSVTLTLSNLADYAIDNILDDRKHYYSKQRKTIIDIQKVGDSINDQL